MGYTHKEYMSYTKLLQGDHIEDYIKEYFWGYEGRY